MAVFTSPLASLWQSAAVSDEWFNPSQLSELPKAARQYLAHAIAPGTQLASAVRLKMHGEIKLQGWQPFKAEQVVCAQKGMIWQATVWLNHLPVFGSDCVIENEGKMQWMLLGLLPIVKAQGPDVTRSAIGRMQGEYVWLPSALLDPAVNWTGLGENCAQVEVTFSGETTQLKLHTRSSGRLDTAQFRRWGNPDERVYRYEDFGLVVEEERTFSGYTIPTKLRAGWYFGCDRYNTEGEFFSATVDEAVYR